MADARSCILYSSVGWGAAAGDALIEVYFNSVPQNCKEIGKKQSTLGLSTL
jgi:hypothetical protein